MLKKKIHQDLHYYWRDIDSYNLPLEIVISKRGLGKTFGKVKEAMNRFVEIGHEFCYVVENLEMVKKLQQNKGVKFFEAIKDYLDKEQPAKYRKLREALDNAQIDEDTKEKDGKKYYISGGTIFMQGKIAGYLVAYSDFASWKRNNLPATMDRIIIDEFISEKFDITSLQTPYKIVNLIQSLIRTRDCKIYMLGNSVRLNDPVLMAFGLKDLHKGDKGFIYDKQGRKFGVYDIVDAEYEYPNFCEQANESVAGKFASILGQDSLERNEFSDALTESETIPHTPKQSHLLCCLHGEAGSVRINATQDYTNFYVMQDYGSNVKQRFCVEPKYITPVVSFAPEWKDTLIRQYEKGVIKFDNSSSKLIFKSILGLII